MQFTLEEMLTSSNPSSSPSSVDSKSLIYSAEIKLAFQYAPNAHSNPR